ncbi:hypothetical protein E1176_15400 [Fulvivirga sp. RKSG066]|uniref:hypothetical protein n=1 Tax=Fulvivirga aurantia TaxID=2529383 RepID=UPI0012BCF152|nr:hypothetical protein [Fulvivirga aurantia]MTI22417.1 hypothetical protein [Fulvivirga aurantia]
MRKFILVTILPCALWACNQPAENTVENVEVNPAAEGFNLKESDSVAITIADSVMVAMGGREAWDNTKVISWNFFGIRDLVWDKSTGRVRIEDKRDSSIYLVNIHENTGRVMRNGEEVTQPDSLKKYVERGKSIWINDSYWLVMPFKLKDSGVTLKYDRKDTTQAGEQAHILALTFNNVGDTPNNKYEVFVDEEDNLIKQWSYFRSFEQDSASAIWPWDNYKEYNGILLSADRSDNRGPKAVKVTDEVPEEVFTEF